MLQKKVNASGQKAYQRSDREDRTLPYRDWLRTVTLNGFCLDIDMIKFTLVDGEPMPVAITELTRTDREEVPGSGYLTAIIDRYFGRDIQGRTVASLAKMLQVPAYLVLFPPSMSWVYVYSFQQLKWKLFTPEDWGDYLKNLTLPT